MRRFIIITSFLGAVSLLTGCAVLTQGLSIVGQATGTVSAQQADSIVKTGKAVAKTLKDITPEQEYYIGRAVGATVVGRYKVYDKASVTEYINVLGQTLAKASDVPETFGGYHFLVLDSDEVNAFATPGGFIFISRGMLKCCTSEDALAAVLAHEVGHVQNQHGLSAIKKGRLTSALTTLAAESAKSFGGAELASLTEAFEGSITDITSTMMNSGYARGAEKDADKAAVEIMQRVGYDPNALVDLLTEMGKQLKPDGHDFAATHPKPESRVKDIKKMIKGVAAGKASASRDKRFKAFISRI